MSLEGNLSDIPFRDLFEIMTSSSQNRMLEIDRQFYRAGLYTQIGAPFACWISKLEENDVVLWLKGEDALHTLAGWDDGLFCITEKEKVTFSRNIFRTKQELMQRNILTGGGYNFQSKSPVQKTNYDKGKIRARADFRSKLNDLDLGMNDWSVLIQLEGEMTLEELAQATRLKIDLVKPVVARLVRLELADFVHSSQNLYNLPAQAPAYLNRAARSGQAYPPHNPTPTVEFVGPIPTIPAPLAMQPVAVNNGGKPKKGIFASIMSKIRSL